MIGPRGAAAGARRATRRRNSARGVPMFDPFGAAGDPVIPFVAQALDPAEVQQRFAHGLPRLAGEHGTVHLRSIRVVRYKPNRRCVIEYGVVVERRESSGRPPAPSQAVTLIGKLRAGHSVKTGYRILDALWEAGFADDSPDGISVPEPIACIAELGVWLQRKVPGQMATELIAGPGGETLICRIAEAAHKLHAAGVPGKRRHSMADEVRILHERLPALADAEPDRAGTPVPAERIARLLDACDRLAAATPPPAPRWVHRDFYPDQVIVDGAAGDPSARLYLIDFDNYCEGDRGLDIGNFLGHMTEQSLRTLGDPESLADRERAMEERFVALSGEAVRPAVRAYATLTLVRHVHLSTLFPERRATMGALLELCEKRLAV